MAEPRRVIGVDPGSIRTGWGVLDQSGSRLARVASGVIQAGDGAFTERLARIYAGLRRLCDEHAPAEAAIEGLFYHKNAGTALKLGHARGVALLALAHAGVPVCEYEPRLVRKALTGHGGAGKEQTQAMVCRLLGVREATTLDETDALAVAICHVHHGPVGRREAL